MSAAPSISDAGSAEPPPSKSKTTHKPPPSTTYTSYISFTYSTYLSLALLSVYLAYSLYRALKEQSLSPSQALFLKASIAALTSGLGGFPLFLVGELSAHSMGLCITFAAGLMSGCSVILFFEALTVEPSVAWVAAYTLGGAAVVHALSLAIGDAGELSFMGLRGQSASKCLLIILSMALHSLGEGISVGVSATAQRESVGLLVIVSLAIHNIPEGIAVSLLLMSQGMGVWASSVFAVLANVPQPLIAIPAFIFLEQFEPALPVGYAVASGAMTYIVCSELIPEALHKISRSALLSTFVASMGVVVGVSVCDK